MKLKSGKKKIEYREKKTFWTSRLFDKEGKLIKYDQIEFINGYNKDAKSPADHFKNLRVICN